MKEINFNKDLSDYEELDHVLQTQHQYDGSEIGLYKVGKKIMLVESDPNMTNHYILDKHEELAALLDSDAFIREHIRDYFVDTEWDSLLWGNTSPHEIEIDPENCNDVKSFSILTKGYMNWGVTYDAVKDFNNDIEVFDTYEEAKQRIDELNTGPVYLSQNEYAGPDYFIVDADILPDYV